jgi:DNA polymerase-1
MERGGLVGLVVGDSVGDSAVEPVVGIAVADGTRRAATVGEVSALDRELRPRWVVWSGRTATNLLAHGVQLSTCWDVTAAQRLLFGGWRVDPARAWARLHDLDRDRIPRMGQLDLLGGDGDGGGDDADPVRPDGYLRPEWAAGGWQTNPGMAARWAAIALQAAELQQARLALLRADGAVAGDPLATARAESTAELLCAELAADGLPIDRQVAETLIESLVGPRPRDDREADELRHERDAVVLGHLPPGSGIDLRNPADVKSMLRRCGIDVPDTRAWRLEAMRDVHPVVEALLQWRKAERVATTFGHTWLATHVGNDGRLRGDWSGSDGAAGRMTAGAGLHNLPAELRPVVVAEPGHVFVRADLGQIEPRVLAAVSGDPALRQATTDDDLYAPVAKRLEVERAIAKVAVLAAMYGQTSGTAGQALRGMERGYPVAMQYLRTAADAGEQGREIRTYGGRLIRMGDLPDEGDYRAMAAARGRYARNAMVQGAAAELFKVWAVTVRARAASIHAHIVLCLHDELLVHVPEAHASEAVRIVDECLAEAAHRWHPTSGVRFVADISTVKRWSDAK